MKWIVVSTLCLERSSIRSKQDTTHNYVYPVFYYSQDADL
jgi:hypothetical protein